MTAVDVVAPTVGLDGPCGWTPDYGPCDDCSAFDALDPAAQQQLEAYAAEVLWRRTGRRFGACTETVRPCRADCDAIGVGWPSRVPGSLDWINGSCGGCAGPCACGGRLAEVTLPGPVADVLEVVVDGAPLDLEADPPPVRVDGYTVLVRQDGQPWPTCVHLGDPPPGGWSVTYTRGRPLPAAGQVAYGALVCELGKACAGQPCRIPGTATNVTRQGVTVALPPVEVLVADGLWGLPLVDQWTAAVTSSRPVARLPVTPDVVWARRQTWPTPT